LIQPERETRIGALDKTMNRTLLQNGLAVLCCSTLAACGAEPSNEEVGDVQSAIVDGHDQSMSASQQSGIVHMVDRWAGKSLCTGTLLTANWVITAGHCFGFGEGGVDGLIAPNYLDKYAFHFGNDVQPGGAGPFNPTSRSASMIVKHPGGIFGQQGFDVALVRLSSPAPSSALPAASYPNGRMRIFAGPSSDSIGQLLTVFGYGKNQGPNGQPPWDSVGILREGLLEGTATPRWGLEMKFSVDGGGTFITNNGDSGGPTFLDIYKVGTFTRQLVGVHSTGTGDAGQASVANDIHAQYFREFVTTVVDEGQRPVEPFPGHGFKVRVQHSKKCLDVNGGSTQSGAAIVQWSCHGNPNQRISLVDMGNGYYSARFAHSNQCMEVSNGSTGNGAAFVQRPCNGSDRQQFKRESWHPDMGGLWSMAGRSRLRWKHSSKCADLAGSSGSNGAALIQSTCHENTNQQLEFLW
jgi:hypothetical protein